MMGDFYNKFSKSNRGLSLFIFLVLFVGLSWQVPLLAQNDNSNSNAAPDASTTPVASPTSIPFSDLITQSDQANATLKEIAANSNANPVADAVERDLPGLTDEINAKLEETGRLVESRSSLEQLRSFETDWRTLSDKLPQWRTGLTDRAKKLEANLVQLSDLDKKWRATAAQLANTEAPPEVTARVQNILTTIAEIRKQVEAQRARNVSLQDKVAEQQKRVDTGTTSIRQTRNALVGQLLVQDSPPLWSREIWAGAGVSAFQQVGASIAAQFRTLNDFAVRNVARIAVHIGIFAVFALLLILLRRWAHLSVENDEALKKAAIIFYFPLSTALILAILFRVQVYPQTPQILNSIFGAIILVPTVLILRNLVSRRVYPVLYSLVVFYFVDLLRGIVDAQISIARLLFLGEMLGGFLFFLWLSRTRLTIDLTEKQLQNKIFKTFKLVTFIALPIFAVAFLTNVLGYVSLSQLLGNAVLRSSYAALILFGLVRIADGLIIFALRFRPLSTLKMVEKYGEEIQSKIRRFLRWLAVIIWVVITLELLNLRDPFFGWLNALFGTPFAIGSISIALGDVVLFVLTVYIAFLLSRFVRFVLDEDVYPRLPLERGLPYAISTILNYTILLVGFFLAVGAAGFDLSKFTILAGAFGVGIGFGLQNIINNFVSGLILLFERPIKVGDSVKVGDAVGIVKNIGIRASIVHAWDNADIIVPNSKLISDNVTNWSYSTQQRGIEIAFSIPLSAQAAPRKIIELMEKAAALHPLVLETKPPQVIFDGITFEQQTFKLRVWTDYYDKTLKIRSDLVLNISEALDAEHIPHEKVVSATEEK